jgi:hypothetical protein
MAVLTKAQRDQLLEAFGVDTTAHICSARKKIATLIQDGEGGLDNYGFINSKSHMMRLRSPCLHGLNAAAVAFNDNWGESQLMISYNTYRARSRNQPEASMKIIFAYLTWLANDSQYSRLFVFKDPKDIWEYGALLRTTGNSPAYVAQASIHMRWISEQTDRIVDNWPLLMKQIPLAYPYNGNLATYFLLAASVAGPGWNISKRDMGHSLFNHSTMTKRGLTNLMRGKDVGKGVLSTSGDYFPLIQAWQGDGAKSAQVDQTNKLGTKPAPANRAVDLAYRAFHTPARRAIGGDAEYVDVTEEGAPNYFKTFIKNNFTPKFIKEIGGLTI